MVAWFVEVCRKKDLKVNEGKSKVMLMNQEDGLKFEVHLMGFIQSMCPNSNIWDVFQTTGTDGAKCNRKVANGKGMVDAIRSQLLLGI